MRLSARVVHVLLAIALLALSVPVAATGAAAGDAASVFLTATEVVVTSPQPAGFVAGNAVPVQGRLTAWDVATSVAVPVEGTFTMVLEGADGQRVATVHDVVAGADGAFSALVAGGATAGLADGTYALRGVGLSDASGLPSEASPSQSFLVAAVDITTPAVWLEHSFVSATGWVKPGESFPLRTFVHNTTDADATGVEVTIAPAPSTTFTRVQPLGDAGTAVINGDGTVTWTIPSVAAAAGEVGTTVTLVTEVQSMTAAQDDRIVWKDLSTLASMTFDGGEAQSMATHGPKVIPPTGGFETARYGDKPFPIVTAAYTDRAPWAESDTAQLDRAINDPTFDGSTVNLYGEMSYDQLYPIGLIPSAGIATAAWDDAEVDRFSQPAVGGACRGTTLGVTPEVFGTPLAAERIVDGWYQLPGDTEYYGGDNPIFPYGALASLPQPSSNDSACGDGSKIVWDAALIADPEIDYNLFDSNRDGIVDFFMLVFVGCGGNGSSQLGPVGCPQDNGGYDNVWPHSSSLEFGWSDAVTGLRGYTSTDQLRSVEEIPQCFLDDKYTRFADCGSAGGDGVDSLPVHVRVGPYNVNPESAIESASVISHEYGHHLGLPDFYNSGSFDASGTFELMASDYSQNMTVFSKQDLGWVVPRYLAPGEQRAVTGWTEIKDDTGEIQWWTSSGESYTLSADAGDQNVHNGQAYAVKLPGRIVITDELFETGGSAPYVWHSGRGNDFGCPPTQGHNLDLVLTDLAEVAAGSTVTLRMQSAWDIEWDWDYGFVLVSTNGEDYVSAASANGYTTDSSYNPNTAGCLDELNNGITGSSAAYAGGEPLAATSRIPANEVYGLPLTFLEDSFDISSLAGQGGYVRLAYFTDPAFERAGWFVDDVEVLVDGEVFWSTNFDSDDGSDDLRLVSGGCDGHGSNSSVFCTVGWNRVAAGAENAADHAYYLELRDRSGFDYEGWGQSDRGIPTWDPGVFVQYTDEDWGYGNNALSHHPAQHYLDSSPVVGEDCPAGAGEGCNDSSFIAEDGRDHFSDAADEPYVGSFVADADDNPWTFGYGCLDLRVTAMRGEDTVDLESDLSASARITAGSGCVLPAFMTAGAAPAVGVLEAVIGVKPDSAAVGEEFAFDGSGSSDDVDPADALGYLWDFGDGASATTQVARHAYDEAGTFEVVLTVTDSDGNTASATRTVTVTAPVVPLPATGGGLVIVGLLAVGGAVRLRRRP